MGRRLLDDTAPVPVRRSGYVFEVSCPQCGGPTVHMADGRPEVLRSTAVFGCGRCDRRYLIAVNVVATAAGGRPGGASNEQVLWNTAAPFASLVADLIAAERELAAVEKVPA